MISGKVLPRACVKVAEKHNETQCRILLGITLTGIVVGICTLELVIDAGIATGMVWPLGSCKSTGKVPDTGLKEERGNHSEANNKLCD